MRCSVLVFFWLGRGNSTHGAAVRQSVLIRGCFVLQTIRVNPWLPYLFPFRSRQRIRSSSRSQSRPLARCSFPCTRKPSECHPERGAERRVEGPLSTGKPFRECRQTTLLLGCPTIACCWQLWEAGHQ